MAITKVFNSTAHVVSEPKKQVFKNDAITPGNDVGIIITDLLGDTGDDGADSIIRTRGKNVFVEFKKGLVVNAITHQPSLSIPDEYPISLVRLRMQFNSLFVLQYPSEAARKADHGKAPYNLPPVGTVITEYQFGANSDALYANCATIQNGFPSDADKLFIFYH